MPDGTRNALTPWWSPLTWLRLVWSVWVDQLWYWQHVRPRMDVAGDRALVLLQGTLGTLIVTLAVVAAAGGVAALAGVVVAWESLLGGAMSAVLVAAVLGVFSSGVVLVAVWGLTLGLALAVVAGIAPLDISPLALVAVAGAVVGLVGGLYAGVNKGLRFGPGSSLLAAAILGVALLLVEAWAEALLSTLFLAVGIYSGSYWATRQVPDAITRGLLARAGAGEDERPPRTKK